MTEATTKPERIFPKSKTTTNMTIKQPRIKFSAIVVVVFVISSLKSVKDGILNQIINIQNDFEHYIKEGFDIELSRNNKSPYKRFTNKEFIEDIYKSKIIINQKVARIRS